MHDIKNHINSKEDTCESKHVIHSTILITICFCCEILCYLKQFEIVTKNLPQKIAHFYKLKW
jgi:hypothetical protein